MKLPIFSFNTKLQASSFNYLQVHNNLNGKEQGHPIALSPRLFSRLHSGHMVYEWGFQIQSSHR